MHVFGLVLLAAALANANVTLPSGKVLKVEVATGEDIGKGLIGRASLPADSGIMFAYPADVQTRYNLMGYRMPVDILYLDEKKNIINLKQNATPCATAECGYPSVWFYRYAIQVPAGTVKRLNIHAGDVLSFELPASLGLPHPTEPASRSPQIKLTVP
jgi:uncharacterized membrane protein (UPF0127 family)